MKKINYIALIFSIIISSCANEAQQNIKIQNSDITVGLLFEVDGCKVYRFHDNGRYIYFTNCEGSTSWSENHGKNNIHDYQVPTSITE